MSDTKLITVEAKDSTDATMIRGLIDYIELMIEHNSPLLSVIDHPRILIKALSDLDSMIEMYDLKRLLVQQIQMMLITAYKRILEGGPESSKFDSHMLHMCIVGPPGVGKSSIGRYIAKVYYGMGVLNQIAKNIKKKTKSVDMLVRSVTVALPRMNYDLADATANECGELLSDVNSLKSTLSDYIKSLGDHNCKPISTCLNQLVDNFGLRVNNVIALCQPLQSLNIESASSPVSSDIKGDFASQPLPAYALSLLPSSASALPPVQATTQTASMVKVEVVTTAVKIVKKEIEEISGEIPIVVCGRSDLIAAYAGQTTIKCSDFLKLHRGKCIIIEEAYLLYTGDRDQFGMEALTELNRHLDEHADENIIILLGYEKLMQLGIFTQQPGLKRRCKNVFTVKGYTPDGLVKIFKSQLAKLGWRISPHIDLHKFFKDNMHLFKSFGGDTENLALACKIAYSSTVFKDLHNDLLSGGGGNNIPDFIISPIMFKEAICDFQTRRFESTSSKSPPTGMYW